MNNHRAKQGSPVRLGLTAAVVAIMAVAGQAVAQDFTEGMRDYDVASEAGDVIGGARACGYKLDMAKVEAFIQSRVAVMAGDDRSAFRSAVDLRDFALGEMAENEREAQCILQRELAKKYGFAK